MIDPIFSSPSASLRGGVQAALGAFALAGAALSAPAAVHAQSGLGPAYIRLEDRRQYSERPITAGFRHLDLQLGVSAEYVDYYRSYAQVGTPLGSFGSHADLVYGLTEFLEVGGGVGLRVPGDSRYLPYVNPERYSQVNHEWLPTGLELSRQPYVLGHEYVTNPYLRARLALVNHAPVYLGIDAVFTLPIARQSCFTVDVGLPLHFVIARVLRIETGVYNEFVACEVAPVAGVATRYWTFMVPLRILANFTNRFWMGVRSGFSSVGYSLAAQDIAFSLGVEAGVRVSPRIDLQFSLMAPEFVHTDAVTGRNVWLDRIGGGIALQFFLL